MGVAKSGKPAPTKDRAKVFAAMPLLAFLYPRFISDIHFYEHRFSGSRSHLVHINNIS